jgi:hypothetical protein
MKQYIAIKTFYWNHEWFHDGAQVPEGKIGASAKALIDKGIIKESASAKPQAKKAAPAENKMAVEPKNKSAKPAKAKAKKQ